MTLAVDYRRRRNDNMRSEFAINVYYNTTSAVYTRLSVNRDMIKHYEALCLLTTPVYVFALPTHVTASLLSTGLFITRY